MAVAIRTQMYRLNYWWDIVETMLQQAGEPSAASDYGVIHSMWNRGLTPVEAVKAIAERRRKAEERSRRMAA